MKYHGEFDAYVYRVSMENIFYQRHLMVVRHELAIGVLSTSTIFSNMTEILIINSLIE